MDANPCRSCGACCAAYRVSFYWREADDATPGGVPLALCQDLNPFYRAMRGTLRTPIRCVALRGQIGIAVHCAIYEHRASPCRDFAVSWENGKANGHCDAARRAYGLRFLDADDLGDESGRPLEPAA